MSATLSIDGGEVLATSVERAEGPSGRARGLLGRVDLPPGTALWIEPAKQVHTFGMRFAIDVVFLAADGIVVHVVREMRPWRVTRLVPRARSVVELPSGAAAAVRVGDRVVVQGSDL